MIVILIIGVLTAIAVPQFMRARGRSLQKTCILNLRKIADAKEVYAQEQKIADGQPVAMTDIWPEYVRGATAPTCPAGGTYTVGRVGENPECSHADADYPHEL